MMLQKHVEQLGVYFFSLHASEAETSAQRLLGRLLDCNRSSAGRRCSQATRRTPTTPPGRTCGTGLTRRSGRRPRGPTQQHQRQQQHPSHQRRWPRQQRQSHSRRQ